MTYEYRALVVRVIDGDTVILDVDLGFSTWLRHQSFRLLGINAREKSDAGGGAAKTNLTLMLPAGMTVILTSVKNDKYGGRYDAHLRLPDGRDLGTTLVQEGWAAPWTGAGTKPLPPWPRKA